MSNVTWPAAEKRVARAAFDDAVASAISRSIAEFKERAAAVTTPSDLWAIESHLCELRREFGEMFDYRYSLLLFLFARFIREGHLDLARLDGLAEEKLDVIRRLLASV
jgi:hypothetical protein